MTDATFELLLKRTQRTKNEDLDRKLVFADRTSIPVGRASKTEQKQLVPAADNAWIRNPVISRTHAEITIAESFGTPFIYIEDKNSSHGTFVNGQKIREKRVLNSGDRLQFGSDVQRGEETFRPPLFDVEIVKMPRPALIKPLPDTPGVNTGRTMSCPEETEESDSASDLGSDAESDKESLSSVQIVEDRLKLSPNSSAAVRQNTVVRCAKTGVPGSQTNPWTLDEAVPMTDTIDLLGDEENSSNVTSNDLPVGQTTSTTILGACGSDAESIAGDEDLMEMYSDSSSESEVAKDERDENGDEEEQEEEDEDEDEYEPEYDLEVNEPLDILPEYAPSSPRYTPTSPISPRLSYNLVPNDIHAVHVEISTSDCAKPTPLREYSPVPAPSNPAFFGYGDGPFAYGGFGPSGKPFHTREPQNTYAWYDFPPPSTAAATISAPAYTFGPSQPNAPYPPAKLTPRASSAVTASTLDMIGANARGSSKNDMSIDNLINPPVEKAPASKKRKADDLANENEKDGVSVPHSVLTEHPAAPTQNLSIASLQERVTVPPIAVSKVPRPIAQPSTKRRKLAYGLRCAAMGAVFGMVGTFATLMSIPDGQFK